ncbi:MAG: RNA-splicing ligase RtcB [Xanthobacteraceae bacterium]|jgi:hypothetical protein|nr:RNA-splicing ligase RtcB [Xanthobacteraceae bacterium]
MFNVVSLEHPTNPTLLFGDDGKPLEFETGPLAAAYCRTLLIKAQPRPKQDDSWRMREQSRFDDGTYKPVSWADETWWIHSEHRKNHFTHLSTAGVGFIAYTETPEKGSADVQNKIRPGRYLEKFFSDILTPNEIRDYATECALLTEQNELFFAKTEDEFEQVYLNGPDSCMAKDVEHFDCPQHPVRIYAAGDLELAYLKRDGDITARALVWGFQPSPWFAHAIKLANELRATGATNESIREALRAAEPKAEYFGPQDPVDIYFNIEAVNEAEQGNLTAVAGAMRELATVPTIRGAAVMPDACPAGTIPVGGVVAAENAIHPGFHSADICCSVAIAVLGNINPKALLDRAMEVTHFGVGGRQQRDQHMPSADVMKRAQENRFLQWHMQQLVSHFATQGDGNHFLFVGQMKSTGQKAIVTHHGSRSPGARLYKQGMEVAERYRAKHAPEVPKGAA